MNILIWILLGIIIVLTAIVWYLLHTIGDAVEGFWKGLAGG